ncbi:putative ABC transporter [Pseudocercospora fijiensis CIRAD86]|uniref:Putative ABC transporter n=1 Tax=Pseudocercospora fijiensis (strain CIRAD86) TaxID=383855 RepID=M3AJ16_PSEFD|nr:putative ABC transporter [Pseudocercospora fijiensis CIRAD86]EME84586.1 putative ABC transporter [Pseudocercospora fijiensis CIRAD86]
MKHEQACPDDSTWGPLAHGCRRGLDFTIPFEHLVVPIALSLLAILVSCGRVRQIWHRPRLNAAGWPCTCKIYIYLVLAAAHISTLAVCSTLDVPDARPYIASAVLSTVVVPFLAVTSLLEEWRSPRPAVIVQGYLVFDISWGVVQARTSWLVANSQMFKAYAGLFTAILALKLGALLLECLPKNANLHTYKRTPEAVAGLFSLASFAWLHPLLRMGYFKPLLLADLYPLPPSLTTTRWLRRPSNPGVTHAASGRWKSINLLSGPLLLQLCPTLVPRALVAAFSFAQVFLLKAILHHLQGRGSSESTKIGYLLIFATFLVYTGSVTARSWYSYSHERWLCMARSRLMEALYFHTLMGSSSALSKAEGLTLMGTEVERIRTGFRSLHELWSCPLEAAFAIWLLFQQVGPAALAPLASVLLVTALTVLLGRAIPKRQRAWIEARQQRTTCTANLVRDMESLQATQLSNAAHASIQSLREHEIDIGQRYRLIQLLILTMAFVPVNLSPVLTLAFTRSNLTTATFYQSIALIPLIAEPVSHLFQVISPFLAACACLGRIRAYLGTKPWNDRRNFEGGTSAAALANNAAITIAGCDLGWKNESPVLHGFNAWIPCNGLTVVFGPTSSGKSTLCKALLGECPYASGQIIMHGSASQAIGFCEQSPVLLNGTIRENITGFATFNHGLYCEVIRAAMLEEDFRQMENGDQAEVGSNGSSLSGGQRSRIALARALYASTSIYILDDVLSGLDRSTAQHVYDNVMGPDGLIKRRGGTAIFATSSRQYVDAADHVIDLTPGCTAPSNDESVSDQVIVSNNTSEPAAPSEKDRGTYGPPNSSYHCFESQESRTSRAPSLTSSKNVSDDQSLKSDLSFYKYYLRSSGSMPLLVFLSLALIYAFCLNFSTIWLSFWNQNRFSESTSFYLGVFGLLKATTLIFLIVSMTACFMLISKVSSREVHRDALHALVHAPLRLFSQLDHGEITSLFSQDMNIIDSELTQAAMNTVLNTFVAIGMTAVLASASPYVLISLPFMLAVCWFVQRVYLRTARRLRILDLEAKEPLYTHFLETVRSISTIRAFGWQKHFLEQNHDMLDTSQRAAYLLAMIQRWLEFVLGMVVTGMATLLVALAVNLQLNAAISGASLIALLSLGEALTTVVEYGSRMDIAIGTVGRLQAFARRAGNNDEAVFIDGEVEPHRLSKGEIKFRNVNVTYGGGTSRAALLSQQKPPTFLALRDVSFTIAASSKVAIVGRTGSGKSTIFRLLLRLLDPLPSSTILIDNHPLAHVPRSVARERIIAVPQTTVLLPDATVRKNLDPYNQCSLEDCLEALDVVGLTGVIRDRGGLETALSNEMLSQGELQLFGLTRAVLRKNQAERRKSRADAEKDEQGGILLLDEIGSAVDAEMYERMWEVILREFRHYTIVAIVHRVGSVVLDRFDQVLAMDRGEVVGDGTPREMLREA